jgi:hypothetical protein
MRERQRERGRQAGSGRVGGSDLDPRIGRDPRHGQAITLSFIWSNAVVAFITARCGLRFLFLLCGGFDLHQLVTGIKIR